MRKENWAIILAAGQGERFKGASGGRAKQFVPYRKAPLFWNSALSFARVPRIDGIIFAFPQENLAEAAQMVDELDKREPLSLPYLCVAGGAERQDSVKNALAALPASCTHVLVHDSARPFASPALSLRLLDELESGHKGVIPGLEPTDTIKQVDEDGAVKGTPPRSSLRMVQTPQAFDRTTLEKAHENGARLGLKVTDDAALLEALGIPVLIIAGEATNIKITCPEDLAMLQDDNNAKNMIPCNGFGYDVHKYGGARPLKLGGVLITNTDITISAHSDGDVLLHALMDALLGCASAGDIGKHFPDTDPRFDGANSAVLLSEVLELVRGQKIVLTHVDFTVIAQAPKIAPFRDEITKNVAKLLHLREEQVNLKATTEEGLGFTGSKEGIKAIAMVSALRTDNV